MTYTTAKDAHTYAQDKPSITQEFPMTKNGEYGAKRSTLHTTSTPTFRESTSTIAHGQQPPENGNGFGRKKKIEFMKEFLPPRNITSIPEFFHQMNDVEQEQAATDALIKTKSHQSFLSGSPSFTSEALISLALVAEIETMKFHNHLRLLQHQQR